MLSIDEAREKIKDKLDDYHDRSRWALWVDYETQSELYDEQARTMPVYEDEIEGVDIYGDPRVSQPLLLPKDVGDVPEGDLVQHNPPETLVKELVDPTMSTIEDVGGFEDYVRLKDEFYYEVERIQYRFYPWRFEEGMRLKELREVVKSAPKNGYEQELTADGVLTFTHDPEPGTEYTSERVFFEYRDEAFDDVPVEERLAQIDIERKIADAAIEAIDGQKSMEMKETVREYVEEDEEWTWVEDSEDLDPFADAVDFETRERDVVIGERVVTLGGIYLTKSP